MPKRSRVVQGEDDIDEDTSARAESSEASVQRKSLVRLDAFYERQDAYMGRMDAFMDSQARFEETWRNSRATDGSRNMDEEFDGGS